MSQYVDVVSIQAVSPSDLHNPFPRLPWPSGSRFLGQLSREDVLVEIVYGLGRVSTFYSKSGMLKVSFRSEALLLRFTGQAR
jgi:hypothetical protein